MRKFSPSIFICLVIASFVCAMEQLPDQTEQSVDAFSYVVRITDGITDNLDVWSLISFSRTCKSFKKICDDKELVKKSIQEAKKFITEPEVYQLLEGGMGQEVFSCPGNDPDSFKRYQNIRIVKRFFSKQAKRYFGDHSVYCVMGDDTIIRCFSHWQIPTIQGNQISDKTWLWANCRWFGPFVKKAMRDYLKKNFVVTDLPRSSSFYNYDGKSTADREKYFERSDVSLTAYFTLPTDKDRIKSFGVFMAYLLLRQYGAAIKTSVIYPSAIDWCKNLNLIEEPS